MHPKKKKNYILQQKKEKRMKRNKESVGLRETHGAKPHGAEKEGEPHGAELDPRPAWIWSVTKTHGWVSLAVGLVFLSGWFFFFFFFFFRMIKFQKWLTFPSRF
jgi:hypothetical protein